MTIPMKVLAALAMVNAFFPEVTHVYYTREGRWQYMDEFFNGPVFDHRIDMDMLDEAADEAYLDKGFPCAYCIPEAV